jgi:hypothetical protein
VAGTTVTAGPTTADGHATGWPGNQQHALPAALSAWRSFRCLVANSRSVWLGHPRKSVALTKPERRAEEVLRFLSARGYSTAGRLAGRKARIPRSCENQVWLA